MNNQDQNPIHIISLGAGVQSSTMSLMAAAGEITPMPNAAIFADTGDEPDDIIAGLTGWRNNCRSRYFDVREAFSVST